MTYISPRPSIRHHARQIRHTKALVHVSIPQKLLNRADLGDGLGKSGKCSFCAYFCSMPTRQPVNRLNQLCFSRDCAWERAYLMESRALE